MTFPPKYMPLTGCVLFTSTYLFFFFLIHVRQISTWKAITAIPHALESTLALLVVIVQDSQRAPMPAILLRQSYATAILRLVNGLVDPLQVSTYARSITSIAQQLGIPSWLVELRHAATHEDLPSLDLLREAARQVRFPYTAREFAYSAL